VAFDVLMVVLSIGSTPFTDRYAVHYGSAVTHALSYLGDLVQVALGALIVIRRPRHPVGWLLLAAVSISQLDQGIVSNFVIYAIDIRHRAIPGGDLVGSFQAMMWMLFVVPTAIFLPLVFPTGKLLSRRWRPVVWAGVIAMVVGFLANGLSPNRDASSYIAGVHPVLLPEPYAAIAAALSAAFVVLLPALIALSIIALVLRYRRGSSDERHQIKWLAFAIAVAGSAGSTSLALSALGHPIPLLQDLDILGIALIPVAAAIAVLRYRLYDIDVVISRTLVYGALALFITTVYVGVVVGIGTLVGSGGQPNLPLSIIATAIVAVAFQPLRERLQKVANRLVYGKRATPYEVLSRFSERVAETYSAEDALPRMARVLAEGTGAETAQVWLRAGKVLRLAAAWPNSSGAEEPVLLQSENLPDLPGAESVPVRHQGVLLGALTVSKRQGESLTPIEHKLLDDLAHQAGLVLKNVGLTSELLARLEDLRASRQRLVAAQDEERRRLERNLHDGAQQYLVAIKIKLGLAESIAITDPGKTSDMIDQLKADTDEALETLRDLARGIYPPLLADQGLAAALQAQARKTTLPVEVDADGIGRYSQDVEAAVYFCVLEALQNTQKYAGAGHATVRLNVHGDELRFEVEDDGKGFDPATQKRGSGTQNMEDRLDALGGDVEVRSAPGQGATVAGRLPVGRLVTSS
jgi:signal transduction histidine kinase